MEKQNDHINNSEMFKSNHSNLLEESDVPKEKVFEESGPVKTNDIFNSLLGPTEPTGDEAEDSWNKFKDKYVGRTVFLRGES